MTRTTLALALVLTALGASGCGGEPAAAPEAEAPARRTVVWLGPEGLDEDTGVALEAAGVDEVVVPWGTVDLAGELPVLRLRETPPLAGGLPVGAMLRLEGLRDDLPERMGEAVWRAVLAEGHLRPVELVLDLPEVVPGTDRFLARLGEASGLPLAPLVSAAQLAEPEVQAALKVAGTAVVLGAGPVGLVRDGAEPVDGRLAEALAPLAALGVRPRVAVVVRPLTQPALERLDDPIDVATEARVSELVTDSPLERSLRFRRALEWSGRSWRPGDTIAVAWLDAARLDRALGEASRLVVPSPAGWDLLWLPPAEQQLGLTREQLLAYLGGAPVEPRLEVRLARRGTVARVEAESTGAFATALASLSNWVEVRSADGSALAVVDAGGFDAAARGADRGDGFRPLDTEAADRVRLYETFVAPGEELRAATLRTATPSTPLEVTWHLTLSSGQVVTGRL